MALKYYVHPQIIMKQKLEDITPFAKYGTPQLIANQVLGKVALVYGGNVIRSPLIVFNEEHQRFQVLDRDWVINLGSKTLFIHGDLRREVNGNVIGWLKYGKLAILENGKLITYNASNNEYREIVKVDSKKVHKYYNLLFNNEGIVALSYDRGGFLLLSDDSIYRCREIRIGKCYDTVYALCNRGRRSLLIMGSRFETPKIYSINQGSIENVQVGKDVVSIQFRDYTHVYAVNGLINVLKVKAEALSISPRNYILMWIPRINWLAIHSGKFTNILTYLNKKPEFLGWLKSSVPVILSERSIKVFDQGMWRNFELLTKPRFVAVGLYNIAVGFHDELLILNSELGIEYELDPQITCTILGDKLICLNSSKELIVSKLSNAIKLGYKVLKEVVDYKDPAIIEVSAPKYSIINVENTNVMNLEIESENKVIIHVKPQIVNTPILNTVININTGLKHLEYPLALRIIEPRILDIKEIKAKSSYYGKLKGSKNGCKGYVEIIANIGVPHVDLDLKLLAQVKSQNNSQKPITSVTRKLTSGINNYRVRMEIPKYLERAILKLTILDEYSLKLSSVEIPINFTIHDISEEILRSWKIKELPNGLGMLEIGADLLSLKKKGYDISIEIICSNKVLEATDNTVINECKAPALLVVRANNKEFEWVRRFSLVPKIEDIGSITLIPKTYGEQCRDNVEISYKEVSKSGIIRKIPQIIVRRNPPILIDEALLVFKDHKIVFKLIAKICRDSIMIFLNNGYISVKHLNSGRTRLEFPLDPLSSRTEIIITDGTATWRYVLGNNIKYSLALVQKLILKLRNIMEVKPFA